jgi:hypothetical protein
VCIACLSNAQTAVQAAMFAGGPTLYALTRRVRARLGLRNGTYAGDRTVAEAEAVTAATAGEDQGEKRRAPAYCRA